MKKRLFLSFLLLLILAFVFRSFLLNKMADYLIIDSEPKKADVIIVLGGEKDGERTKKAVELYQEGVADQLLFSDGTKLSWRTNAIDEMIALAQQLGVPNKAINRENQSKSTYENALYTKKLLQKKGWKSAVVVTTNWHSRRSKFIFNKVYKKTGIKLSFVTAKDSRFSSLDNWWKDHEKEQTILTEWAKLVVYWIQY